MTLSSLFKEIKISCLIYFLILVRLHYSKSIFDEEKLQFPAEDSVINPSPEKECNKIFF